MPDQPKSALFPATMWSALIEVQEGGSSEAILALERLAHAYWQPLYVFVRQRGLDHEHAADAVQGFFTHLISGEVLRRVERRESRFRSFLLTAFQNWLTNERERAAMQKRGGGATHITLAEFDSAQLDPALAVPESPERSFDRRWARAVFDHAVARLDAEIAQKERAEFLRELRLRLIGPAAGQPNWEEVATRFGLNANTVKQAAHTLRQRFAVLLKHEVRAVVGSEADLAEELRYLIELLSGAENNS